MAIKVITEPTTEPVSLQECKDHLRIVHDDEDTLIEAYAKAARRYVEQVLCWRALITQELELVLDNFQSQFKLPRPPLQEITSIKYTDKDGTEHTVDADNYIVDTDSEPGRIVPAYGKSWPTDTLEPINAVRIRYKAGYGDNAEDVPQELRQAILILTAHFYEMREPVVVGQTVANVPWTVEALSLPYRAWGGDVE